MLIRDPGLGFWGNRLLVLCLLRFNDRFVGGKLLLDIKFLIIEFEVELPNLYLFGIKDTQLIFLVRYLVDLQITSAQFLFDFVF